MLRLFRRNREQDREKTQKAVRRSRESWFGRVMDALKSHQLDDATWDKLEETLISADMGVETSLAMIARLKARAREERLDQPAQIVDALRQELLSVLESGNGDLGNTVVAPNEAQNQSTPLVILVVGVNGAGKTTSIAKLAYHFNEAGKKVVLGASDTYRAAAIDQLQVWGSRAGAEVVSHQPGADPGAVAFDAYQASSARKADVLIIDTAGRLQTKSNLMQELSKIKRVLERQDPSAPHQVILIMDATTGQNGLSQARSFTEAVDCTGIFLAKLDGTAKGGIVLAIKNELHLPILFIGTGEGIDDLAPFDPKEFVDALLEPSSSSQSQ